MTEIEKVKADIKVLEATLLFLEERDKHKSPEEEAFKRWMNVYPPTTPSVDNQNDIRWRAFQMGYDAAKKDWKVGEYMEKTDKITLEPAEQELKMIDKYVELNDETRSVLDKIKDAYPEPEILTLFDAIRNLGYSVDCCDEIVTAVERFQSGDNVDVGKLVDQWEENPPKWANFGSGKTLEDKIYKWWETCFVTHCEWSMEECVEDLLDIIELFLFCSKRSSSSQNAYTEVSVETHNDLLDKIKSKLRNKKV